LHSDSDLFAFYINTNNIAPKKQVKWISQKAFLIAIYN